jgi:hypothetical protein
MSSGNSFNPQNAAVYGLTALQFNSIFSNYQNIPFGTATSINNSFATVLPFSFTIPQTPGNPQAIEYLFPSINTGPDTYFNISTTNPNFKLLSAWFEPFSDTSSVIVTPVNQTATANLDVASLVSDETVVASATLTFTFIPGTTQSLSLAYSEGTTLSTTVTNGISTTDSESQTTTVSTGVKASGTLGAGTATPASAEVNESVSEAWTIQESKTINYSESQTETASTNVTSTVTVNVNTATPTSNGQYIYTNSNGQTFYLIPGNQYITQIQMDSTSYTTPVPNSFTMTGQNMSLPMNISYLDMGLVQEKSSVQTENVESAIYWANYFQYYWYSNVDPSLFTYQTTPISQAVYSGLLNSTSVTGTDATVVILPVATTEDAIVANTLSSGLSSTNNFTSTRLDLRTAAEKLLSKFGIYYNNVNNEGLLKTKDVDISGYSHASVKIGNLDYTLTNFSHSIIETGSGDNTIRLAVRDSNNSFKLGSGNNEVFLSGNQNNIRMGDGANWINVEGVDGRNYVVAGDGPTALSFNKGFGFTQVSNWDVSEDAILFSPDIARENIRVSFDSARWAYDVYINDNHVANILSTGGLKFANEASVVYPQTYAPPMPYNLQSNSGFVNGLYVDSFARAADSAGLSFWTQQLDGGASRKSVIQNFLTSSEYNSMHLTNSQFIEGLYHDILGRQEDVSGANYWEGQLNSGVARATVVGTFLASSEFNNLVGIS